MENSVKWEKAIRWNGNIGVFGRFTIYSEEGKNFVIINNDAGSKTVSLKSLKEVADIIDNFYALRGILTKVKRKG
jgi:tryptophanase